MIKILLIIALSIALHEAGHFITAKILKQNIISVQLFLFPVFYMFLNGTLYKIGLVPIIGYINCPGIYKEKPIKQIIYFSAGILVNSLLLFIPDPFIRAVNLYLIIFTLIPFRNSDGINILRGLQKCLPLYKPKN